MSELIIGTARVASAPDERQRGGGMSEPASSSSAQRVLRVRLTSASEEGA
jgi:hypothetical protein